MKRKTLNLLLISAVVLMLCGCGTVCPPGKKVIVLHASGESTSVDKGVYYCWGRDLAFQVDQKLKSFSEDLQILCADDVNMAVEIKAVLSFEVDDESVEFIKQKVPALEVDSETKELSLEQFYEMTVKDIVLSSARIVISQLETDDIRPQREQIEADVATAVRARVAALNYPLNVSAILLSNIDYPEIVTKQREAIKTAQLEDQKQAALAEAAMAEAQRRAGIETEEAKVRMIRAQAQADENRILAQSLTPEYLSWRQLEVMEHVSTEMAKGQNDVVFIMPYEAISQDTMNTAMMRESISEIGQPRVVSEVVE